MGRVRQAILALAASGMLLASCGGGHPAASPRQSPSAHASPSAQPTPELMPEVATACKAAAPPPAQLASQAQGICAQAAAIAAVRWNLFLSSIERTSGYKPQ